MKKYVKNKFSYTLRLAAGFTGLVIPELFNLAEFNGLLTLLWLYVFLDLSIGFNSRKEQFITGAVFALGYYIKHAGSLGIPGLDLLLVGLAGLVMYLIFLLSARLMERWKGFFGTFVFPVVWMLSYLGATALRLPTLLRVDSMLTDMVVLLQSERILGSFGLSFAVLWFIALLHYGISTRRMAPIVCCNVLVFALMLPGMVMLRPNVEAGETLRIAYTTGPYVGDFLNYRAASYEECAGSLEKSLKSAAEQGAELLVFTEEAFAISGTDEKRFTELCCDLAKENNVAVLVGLDVSAGADNKDGKSKNKLVFICNNGEIQGSYVKSKLIPILEKDYEAGEGIVPSHTLDFGGKIVTLSYLICYDSNFPDYVGSIDPNTDLLILPSWDWGAVTELHSSLCRAIAAENGVYLLKPTYDGKSIAVSPDGNIFSCTYTEDTGYETLQLVDMPIKSRDIYVNTTLTQDPYTYAIIGTEILAFMICMVLFAANSLLNNDHSRKNRLFNILIGVNGMACMVDALSWIMDGSVRLERALYFTTFVSYLLSFILLPLFLEYFAEHVKGRGSLIIKNMWWIWGCITALTIGLFYGSYSGKLFYFDEGVYIEGPWVSGYVVVNIVGLLIALGIIIYHRKYISLYDKISAYVYLLVPLASAAVNIFLTEWSFAFPAVTLSLILAYVMLQTNRLEAVELESSLARHYATHDELTGLYNRRAYEEKLAALRKSGESCGIIFGDINGLKYTNDNFGHEYGDKLLSRYAGILSKVFRQNEIYRISGDEFICLMESLVEETFLRRTEELRSCLGTGEDQIACIGAAFGNGAALDELIKTAEAAMIEEKNRFHSLYPKTKRNY